MKPFPLLVGLCTVVSMASVALADPPGHYDAPTVLITGHRNHPSADVEISKMKPRVDLRELKQPLAARVAQAVTSDPF
jgi:hypothetical protein